MSQPRNRMVLLQVMVGTGDSSSELSAKKIGEEIVSNYRAKGFSAEYRIDLDLTLSDRSVTEAELQLAAVMATLEMRETMMKELVEKLERKLGGRKVSF